MTDEIVIYNQWYDKLVDDLTDIIDGVVEDRFHLAWSLVNGYHQVGVRILQENDNFEREKIYGEKIVQRIATSIGRSDRTVRYCIKFARLYPELNMLPEGKDINWGHIVTKYLTTGEKKPTVKKADLYRMIKEIKTLLEREWQKNRQEAVFAIADSTKDIVYLEQKDEFIRYLQDQVNKITKEMEA